MTRSILRPTLLVFVLMIGICTVVGVAIERAGSLSPLTLPHADHEMVEDRGRVQSAQPVSDLGLVEVESEAANADMYTVVKASQPGSSRAASHFRRAVSGSLIPQGPVAPATSAVTRVAAPRLRKRAPHELLSGQSCPFTLNVQVTSPHNLPHVPVRTNVATAPQHQPAVAATISGSPAAIRLSKRSLSSRSLVQVTDGPVSVSSSSSPSPPPPPLTTAQLNQCAANKAAFESNGGNAAAAAFQYTLVLPFRPAPRPITCPDAQHALRYTEFVLQGLLFDRFNQTTVNLLHMGGDIHGNIHHNQPVRTPGTQLIYRNITYPWAPVTDALAGSCERVEGELFYTEWLVDLIIWGNNADRWSGYSCNAVGSDKCWEGLHYPEMRTTYISEGWSTVYDANGNMKILTLSTPPVQTPFWTKESSDTAINEGRSCYTNNEWCQLPWDNWKLVLSTGHGPSKESQNERDTMVPQGPTNSAQQSGGTGWGHEMVFNSYVKKDAQGNVIDQMSVSEFAKKFPEAYLKEA